MICDGNCNECKYDDCIKDKRDRHDYYMKNRERIIAYTRKWNKEHPDKVREYQKKSKRDRTEYQHQYYLRKKKEHMERMIQG